MQGFPRWNRCKAAVGAQKSRPGRFVTQLHQVSRIRTHADEQAFACLALTGQKSTGTNLNWSEKSEPLGRSLLGLFRSRLAGSQPEARYLRIGHRVVE